MRLDRKGFAVTGIIYSMLILFLALVLLILSNLASRKVLFDKEKNEILDKINGTVLCTAIAPTTQNVPKYDLEWTMSETTAGVQATSDAPYALGAEYTCELGDGVSRTFYVLGTDGDNVKLIMNENLGNTVAWCDQSGTNPYDNVCAADGANAALAERTSGWTKLSQSQITLPEGQDIADAMGDTEWNDANYTGKVGPTWMYVNLDGNNGPYGYWTSTPYSGSSDSAWFVFSDGGFLYNSNVGTASINGVRPVITISKSNLSL